MDFMINSLLYSPLWKIVVVLLSDSNTPSRCPLSLSPVYFLQDSLFKRDVDWTCTWLPCHWFPLKLIFPAIMGVQNKSAWNCLKLGKWFASDLANPDVSAQFLFLNTAHLLAQMKYFISPLLHEMSVVSWNTCLNSAFNVNRRPPPGHGLFWNRSGESLLSRFRKTDPARPGPGGGMGGRRW